MEVFPFRLGEGDADEQMMNIYTEMSDWEVY